jgi:hypothetical protein
VKTLKGAKRRNNMFMVKQCAAEDIFAVLRLKEFVVGCRDIGVDFSYGYIFRIVAEDRLVLDKPVTY